ncbi:MAG: hypothetical protein ABI813_15200 [Bacteroidota bacterium]
MTEHFVITASYKNQERNFDAVLISFGYSYKIEVAIDGATVVFERDEEKNYRAYLPADAHTSPAPDPHLLEAVAQALEKAFR